MKYLESELRNLVRSIWGLAAEWTEPTYGSSVGVPDVALPLGNGRVPVELKVGTLAKAVRFKARPAQRRWHVLARERGERSLFLIAARGWLFVLNGAYINEYDYFWEGRTFKRLGKIEEKAKILLNFNALDKDKEFWEWI